MNSELRFRGVKSPFFLYVFEAKKGKITIAIMIAKVQPHPDQVRRYANSALNAFHDLEPADAIDHAKMHLKGLLAYLDAIDGADHLVGELQFTDPLPRINFERLASRKDVGNPR